MLEKYERWPTPFERGPMRIGQKSIEEEVLSDLEAAKDDKLMQMEILDSFAAYYNKCYRAQMIETFTHELGRFGMKMAELWLDSLLPSIKFASRRAATRIVEKKEGQE